MSLAGDIRDMLPGPSRPLRLGTLVGLRWLAVGGQAMGVLFVEIGLGFPVPLLECFGLIALSVLLNLWLIFRFGAAYRPGATVSTIQLGWDCLQLGGLLPLRGAGAFRCCCWRRSRSRRPPCPALDLHPCRALIAVASVLGVWYLPLPWDPSSRIVFDRVHVIGIWVSLVCGVVFVSAYTNRVAHEARQLADALAATELALSAASS